MHGFKELSDDSVQFGSKKFKTIRHSWRDGITRTLEVGGSSKSGHTETLLIEDLKNIRIMDFPNEFDIFIYMPSLSDAPEIEGINIKHVFGKGSCSISIGFIYAHWRAEKNLFIYSKELAAKILLHIPECNSVNVEDEEVGTRVNCIVEAPKNLDLFDYIKSIESKISRLIKKSDPFTISDEPKKLELKPDEHGVMWWFRYAIIPIIGSATVIGIIKLLTP